MTGSVRFAARVALFSALAYVLALASVYIPNVSLIFIVVFAAGVLHGLKAGLLVGGIGEFLWTIFNPYGMAALPITAAQVVGMILVGALGGVVSRLPMFTRTHKTGFAVMALMGLASGLIFQLVVNLVSAFLFQPFWESLAAGMMFSLITILSNGVIFTLCYPMLVKLRRREGAV